MDPHYYNADEFAMNFEGRIGYFAQLFSKIVPETVDLAPGGVALAGAAMMVLPPVRGIP
jgi:hypothetical protein